MTARKLQDMIADKSRTVLNRIGSDCVYTSSTGVSTVSAFLKLTVMDVGEYGNYVGDHIEIEFLKSDVSPKRGDTAEIGGVKYTIEGIVVSDEANNSTVRVAAHEG